MSLQRDVLNTALKSVVKPFLKRVPFYPPLVAMGRPYLNQLGAIFLRPPRNVSIQYCKIGAIPAEWLVPEHLVHDERVLLYFHGGGYLACSPKTHRNITGRLAALGQMKVLAINYRKAPEHPFPAPLEDAVEAYKHLLLMGYEPKNIVLAGDSAGGHLTLSTLIALREAKLGSPRAAVCISPWTDLTVTGSSMHQNQHLDPMIPAQRIRDCARHVVGDLQASDPSLTILNADLKGLPPLLIHVGDTEVLRSDAERLAAKATQHGVIVNLKLWENMPHVFHLFAGFVPQSSQAIFEIGQFIARQFKEPHFNSSVIAFPALTNLKANSQI